MAGTARIVNTGDWVAKELALAPTRVQRGAQGQPVAPVFPSRFRMAGVSVDHALEIAPTPARRGGPAASVDLELDVAADETSLIALIHPSGAITFHAPVGRADRAVRRGVARGPQAGSTLRFRIEPPIPHDGPVTRGWIGAALKALVLKIAAPAIDAARSLAGSLLAKGGERILWKVKGLKPGWHSVRPGSSGLVLTPANPSEIGKNDRSLLLIHGTFSNAASGFKGLAGGTFFTDAAQTYGNRVLSPCAECSARSTTRRERLQVSSVRYSSSA